MASTPLPTKPTSTVKAAVYLDVLRVVPVIVYTEDALVLDVAGCITFGRFKSWKYLLHILVNSILSL